MASIASESHFVPAMSPSDRHSQPSSSSSLLPTIPSSSRKRPFLSTSLSDFALSNGSSSLSAAIDESMPSTSKDDAAPVIRRKRRPTTNWWLGERVNSPLTNAFTFPHPYSRSPKRRSSSASKGRKRSLEDDVDVFRCDKDRMTTDSSSPSTTSESDATPPMTLESSARMDEVVNRHKGSPMDLSRSASPAAALKPPADISETPAAGPSQTPSKRYPQPVSYNVLHVMRYRSF